MDSSYLRGTLGTCEIDFGHLMDSKDQDMAVGNLEVDSRHMRWVLDK